VLWFLFCLRVPKKKTVKSFLKCNEPQNAILWTPLVTPLARLDTGLCKGWPFLIYGRWSQRGQWKMGCIQILGWREARSVDRVTSTLRRQRIFHWPFLTIMSRTPHLLSWTLGGGLRPMEASPRARPSGEGVLLRIPSFDG
jgi:hypothetical protein